MNTLTTGLISFFQIIGQRIRQRFWQLLFYVGAVLVYQLVYPNTFEQVFSGLQPLIFWIIVLIGFLSILFYQGNLHDYALLVILLFGLVNVFIMPILDSPDEQAHIRRAYLTSVGNLIPYTDGENGYASIKSIEDLNSNVSISVLKTNIDSEPIDYETAYATNVAASNIFIGYLPQALGILIARLFQLNTIWLLWLGRLFNLFFYAFLCRKAIKIAPHYKMALFLTSTIPLAVYQGSSMSVDASINAYALLSIAYFLRLYYADDKTVTWKNILVLVLLTMLTGLCKLTYFALSCLILLIPTEKFRKKSNYYWCYAVVAAVGLMAVFWYIFTTIIQPDYIKQNVYSIENNISFQNQLTYVLTHKKQFIYIILRKIAMKLTMTTTDSFIFGWLSYSSLELGTLYTGFYTAVMLLYPNSHRLRKSTSGWLFFLILLITISTLIIFYFTWTPTGLSDVLGSQPRYYIPLLALLPMVFGLNNGVAQNQLQMNLCFINNFFIACMLVTTSVVYYAN